MKRTVKRPLFVMIIICGGLCLSSCAFVGAVLQGAYDEKAVNDCAATAITDSLPRELGQNPGCVKGYYSRSNIPPKWDDDDKDE